jgi:polyisoprenoid-binding protein YceI
MLKSKIKTVTGILGCLVFLTMSTVQAQTYKMVPKISVVKILGTSSVHNWESSTDQINGDMVLATDGKSGKQIQSLVVKVPVKSIKSGKGLMDSKTYDAFESDKNPLITFQMTEISSVKLIGKDVETTVAGNLTMAGNTKKITIKSTGKVLADGSFQFKGSVPLKLSEFKMKSPTAMMGMLKTGDAVTINFDVTFKSM